MNRLNSDDRDPPGPQVKKYFQGLEKRLHALDPFDKGQATIIASLLCEAARSHPEQGIDMIDAWLTAHDADCFLGSLLSGMLYDLYKDEEFAAYKPAILHAAAEGLERSHTLKHGQDILATILKKGMRDDDPVIAQYAIDLEEELNRKKDEVMEHGIAGRVLDGLHKTYKKVASEQNAADPASGKKGGKPRPDSERASLTPAGHAPA